MRLLKQFTLPPQLVEWMAQIDRRTKRERMLVLCVGLIVLYTIWNLLLHQRAVQGKEAMSKEKATIEQQLTAIKLQISTLSEASEQSGIGKEQKKKVQITQQIEQLERQLKKVADQLLPPQSVSAFLEKMMQGESGLKLVQLQSLPVESLLEASKAGETVHIPYAQLGSVTLYRHPILLVLEGGYLDTMRFIERLEKLSWRVFWDEVDYQVIKYPTGRVTMKFHTLSEQKGRIGL